MCRDPSSVITVQALKVERVPKLINLRGRNTLARGAEALAALQGHPGATPKSICEHTARAYRRKELAFWLP